MSKNITYQQCQWIIEAYKSIIEAPESYGYDTPNGHLDEIVDLIKEDVNNAFNCAINDEIITNIIITVQNG